MTGLFAFTPYDGGVAVFTVAGLAGAWLARPNRKRRTRPAPGRPDGGEPQPAVEPWPQDPGGVEQPHPVEVSDLTADALLTQWATAAAPTEETTR